jgi:hypothetical protein
MKSMLAASCPLALSREAVAQVADDELGAADHLI